MPRIFFSGLPTQDNVWYQALISGLDQSQMKEIEDVFKLADQRKAVAGICMLERWQTVVVTFLFFVKNFFHICMIDLMSS